MIFHYKMKSHREVVDRIYSKIYIVIKSTPDSIFAKRGKNYERRLLCHIQSTLKQRNSLIKVDYAQAVALLENKILHFRVVHARLHFYKYNIIQEPNKFSDEDIEEGTKVGIAKCSKKHEGVQ